MSTRIIGIDLAVTAEHQAAILDPASKQFVVKQMAFRSLPDDLDRLLQRARAGAGAEPELIVVLEATSMAWHPVGIYQQTLAAPTVSRSCSISQERRHRFALLSHCAAFLTTKQLRGSAFPSGAQSHRQVLYLPKCGQFVYSAVNVPS